VPAGGDGSALPPQAEARIPIARNDKANNRFECRPVMN
jgi:hypothetical protein